VREEERTGDGVIKLMTIVTLDGLDSETELCGHPSEEMVNRRESIRLHTQGKSPQVMLKIINHHKIVFIARNAQYRRCPQIAVYKIKTVSRMRRGTIKRKTNMTAQLARMTQLLIMSSSTSNV
jgi:hypothetical protein